MARLGDQIQVKVSDGGSASGKRKFALEVEASDTLFYLTDALSREGIVKELKTELRSVVRDGVVKYVQQSRELIKKLGESGKVISNGKGKIKANLDERT